VIKHAAPEYQSVRKRINEELKKRQTGTWTWRGYVLYLDSRVRTIEIRRTLILPQNGNSPEGFFLWGGWATFTGANRGSQPETGAPCTQKGPLTRKGLSTASINPFKP
jgi:hypothetical protein